MPSPGLLCECGVEGCRETLPIGYQEYDRAARKGYVVCVAHAYDAGRVIESNALYAIVADIERESCVKCGDMLTPADSQGLCLHCHWVVRGMVEVGLREVTDYLAAWTKFEQWCAERGRAA